jgi:acyl-CoA synthetase (AMP-forming)/AMP-acid ligase II
MFMTATNVASHLKETSARLPNGKAILSANGKFPEKSFSELYRDVRACSAFLKTKGIEKGDKALLFVRSGYELIVLAFSLFFIGAVPVIIDPGMGLSSILRCIRTTQPNHMIGIPLAHWVSRFFRRSFKGIRGRILIRSNRFNEETLSTPAEKNSNPVNVSPKELAAIVFTSGSTGPPKGVCYMHKTFDGQISALRENFGMQEGEVDMTTLPIFALFNPALGITTVMPEIDPSKPAKASAQSLVETLVDFEVTTAFASPVIGRKIADWCEHGNLRLPRMNRFFLAGAPSPPQLVEKLASVMDNGQVLIPYGATEALPVSYCTHADVMRARKGIEQGEGSCLGKALPGVSIKLFPVSASPFGNEVEEVNEGQVGEICVAGPTVTEEYYRMPGATFDSKFRYDSQIYHRMGDLGYFDVDLSLRFLGRKAERLNTKHGPLETERCEAIVNTVNGVRRSALVGLGQQDPVEPCVVIEPNEEFQNQNAKDEIEGEVLRRLKVHLPHFEITQMRFENSLPVDARHNAKIHRLALAKKWTKRLAP